MQEFNVEATDVVLWRSRLRSGQSPSELLRDFVGKYGLTKFDAASAFLEMFNENVQVEDMQVIWKWDIGGVGEGFTDQEIDELLNHLRKAD